VEHRHLLPDEFDLLVDGAEGFGVAPLVGHVETCASCAAELDRQRRLVLELERLPRFTTSPLFALHVMREVQVFEPWYVPALDSVRRYLPRTQPVRVLMGSAVVLFATALTLSTVWIVTRLDLLAFLLSVGADRVRAAALGLAETLASSTFGVALNALGGGGATRGVTGVGMALTLFLLTVVVATLWLRGLSAISRRRRA